MFYVFTSPPFDYSERINQTLYKLIETQMEQGNN